MISPLLRAALAFAALTIGARDAGATTYVSQNFTCPVGGERFSAQVMASTSTWGGLPDGMPIGSADYPIVPVTCPGNGLPMYREFSAAEVQRLHAFLASAEWRRLRADELPHFRIWHIATLLQDDDALWYLLEATWAAKADSTDAARAIRYQELLIARVLAMPSYPARRDLVLLARTANALRELDRFADARALIARFPLLLEQLGVGARTTSDDETESFSEFRDGLMAFGRSLIIAIDREDAHRVPLDMVGESEAAFACQTRQASAAAQPLSAFDSAFCARPEIRAYLERAD